jgi:hypothetical protein
MSTPKSPDTFATRAARAAHIDRRLAELYPETPVPLDHRDAYTLLIAVLLSAQCTDKRVNLVTPALFKLADNPAAMAARTASIPCVLDTATRVMARGSRAAATAAAATRARTAASAAAIGWSVIKVMDKKIGGGDRSRHRP